MSTRLIPVPNYTQTPNLFFELMPELSDSELRIMLAAIRQTIGWHRNDPQPMSVSWFQEQTGLSHQAVRNGIKQATARGWLQQDGIGGRGVHLFVVNFVDPSTTLSSEGQRPLNVVDPSKERDIKEKDSMSPTDSLQASKNSSTNQPILPDPSPLENEAITPAAEDSFEYDFMAAGELGAGGMVADIRADPAHECGVQMKITADGCVCPACGRVWYDESFYNERKSLTCKGCGVFAYDGNSHDTPDPNMKSLMLEWKTELCQSCLTRLLVEQGDSGAPEHNSTHECTWFKIEHEWETCTVCGKRWYDEDYSPVGKSLECKQCGRHAHGMDTEEKPLRLEWEAELCQTCLTESLTGQGNGLIDIDELDPDGLRGDVAAMPGSRIGLTALEVQSETSVVNFQDVKEHWSARFKEWDDPQYVYIGRDNPSYMLPQSIWANKYIITPDQTREETIMWYRRDIEKRLFEEPELKAKLESLRGKILVCWCKEEGKDVACHGDVLVELLNGKNNARTNGIESTKGNSDDWTKRNEINMGSAKSEASPVPEAKEQSDARAITDIIKAWLDATGRIDPKAYAKKGWRDIALAIHRAGITPDQVTAYVQAKRRDDFWADKEITITKVASEIQAWLKSVENRCPKCGTQFKTIYDDRGNTSQVCECKETFIVLPINPSAPESVVAAIAPLMTDEEMTAAIRQAKKELYANLAPGFDPEEDDNEWGFGR